MEGLQEEPRPGALREDRGTQVEKIIVRTLEAQGIYGSRLNLVERLPNTPPS